MKLNEIVLKDVILQNQLAAYNQTKSVNPRVN